mgnify:CR=1 FL=1
MGKVRVRSASQRGSRDPKRENTEGGGEGCATEER